jgi:hypothetical protein
LDQAKEKGEQKLNQNKYNFSTTDEKDMKEAIKETEDNWGNTAGKGETFWETAKREGKQTFEAVSDKGNSIKNSAKDTVEETQNKSS